MWIFLLVFVGAPLVELYLLIQVGSVIGALPTIGLSVLTALIGGALVRLQGLGVLMRVREALDRGEAPALELMDGAVLLACGFLLLLPGFVTDIIGFLLLVPPLRQALVRRYLPVVPLGPGQEPGAGPVLGRGVEGHRVGHRQRIIDGEYRRED